jgi:hypothetical protein
LKAEAVAKSVLVGFGGRHLSFLAPRPLGEACLQVDAIYPTTTTTYASMDSFSVLQKSYRIFSSEAYVRYTCDIDQVDVGAKGGSSPQT